jgi:plastocyanin
MKLILLVGVVMATAISLISIELPEASAQRVFGDYLVRIPPGATVPGSVHYEPAEIVVPVGTTVVWVNDDPDQPHTVTSGVADSPDARELFHSGIIRTDAFFSHTFDEPGEYSYHCEIHPRAAGRVTVGVAIVQGQNFEFRYGVGPVFDFTEHERNLLTISPTTIDVAEDQAALYRITIIREGEEVFLEQFRTIGGNLHLELIPTDEPTRVTGPAIFDPQTGAFSVSGSFLKEVGQFSIRAEVLSIADRTPTQPIVDEFNIQIVPEFPAAVLAGTFAIGGIVAYSRFRGFFQ